MSYLKKERKVELPKNIKLRQIKRSFKIEDKSCLVTLDASFGEVDGKEVLLDEPLVEKMVRDIIKVTKNNSTKYNPMPTQITLSHETLDTNTPSNNEENKQVEMLNCYEPKWDLNEVYLEPATRKQINAVLNMILHRETLYKEWGLDQIFKRERGIILNFYGKPGTGKSITAEAIAKQIHKKVCLVNYSQLESKYVGDTPKNISHIFKVAKENDAVLIFDEADSFLGKRLTNVTQSADHGVNITRSVMLLELEKYEGVVIFTTNLLTNYDEAFKRRILSSIEFDLPDEMGRKAIWQTHLPKKLPLASDVHLSYLAHTYDQITGADIKDIVLNAALIALEDKKEEVMKKHFDKAYQYIKNRYKEQSGREAKVVKAERVTADEIKEFVE